MSFKHVGLELQGLLSEWMEKPQARGLVLGRIWEEAVGEAVSRHCRPLVLEDSVLMVEVTDLAWKPQLEAMSADLIGKSTRPWVSRGCEGSYGSWMMKFRPDRMFRRAPRVSVPRSCVWSGLCSVCCHAAACFRTTSSVRS